MKNSSKDREGNKCQFGHNYGFTKGLNILTGKGRKRYKCIVCGYEETKPSQQDMCEKCGHHGLRHSDGKKHACHIIDCKCKSFQPPKSSEPYIGTPTTTSTGTYFPSQKKDTHTYEETLETVRRLSKLMKKEGWENELRLGLDRLFEDLQSYTGPNIDEDFTRTFEYTKSFIKSLLKEERERIKKELSTITKEKKGGERDEKKTA